jgi:ATP-dependent Clp protease protease subunit
MGAVLLAAGTKGKRYSLPHSRILIHQPSMSGLAGQAADIDIYAKEILRMREILNEILANSTGQTVEKIARDVDRDYIMEPEQAVTYGMIDRVITSRDLAPAVKV